MREIELRRILHQHPEPSFKEFTTHKILKKFIEELNFGEIFPVETGLVIVRRMLKDNSFVLFRAEMDALEIEEKTNYSYRSKNNFMHACGHDFHMAALYGLMKRIVERNFAGNVICVFQPGEETGCGALKILNFLLEKGYDIKAAVAMHVTDEYPVGTIASKPGTLFCASLEIDVEVVGQAAHAAFHWMGKDALRTCVEFLEKFYKMSWCDDLVWFGKIAGGRARNVVADEVVLQGTIRSKKLEKIDSIVEKLNQTLKEICLDLGTSFQIKRGATYRQVEVNEKLFSVLKQVAVAYGWNFVECDTKFTAEDFGYFSQYYPALMFWFGTKERETYGLHSDRFLPADELVPKASEFLYSLLLHLMIF
ncbi:M20 family metallopeptidase [Pseudothermotoga thermarum]|uniref:Amidohydrolase n=1 Tax=Pseudothermotoga thermarum DSM 5069 TaxID=688269 RepID=F7YWF5_9THEM|nr:M20 family metallopeptidase [Pseudothermotoga thermarum]AEH51933.1 amidohydrolase [Pseudothermotoga thermarum DSM 5069]